MKRAILASRLVLLVAALPGVARADDAAVAASVTKRPTQAFVSFGDSGALLIRAVQMVKAGQSEAEVTPTLNQAKGRANAGTTRLRKAAPPIAAIAR